MGSAGSGVPAQLLLIDRVTSNLPDDRQLCKRGCVYQMFNRRRKLTLCKVSIGCLLVGQSQRTVGFSHHFLGNVLC